MRTIAIFVILIFLITFIAPSLGQQTPDQATLKAQKCADLNQQLDQLTKDRDTVDKQTASEDRSNNLKYYDNKISIVNNQLILNGCKNGTVADIPSTISQPSSQPSTGTTTKAANGTANGTSQPTSDPWEGTWYHRGGTLELKQSDNALSYLGEVTSNLRGPSLPDYNFEPSPTYVGILTWNTPPYDSKPLKAAVFAFIKGNKLEARFTTAYSAFEAALPSDQYSSQLQSLVNENKNGVIIGKFVVQLSGPDTFTGTMSPVQIDLGTETQTNPTYHELGQYAFDAQRRTSP